MKSTRYLWIILAFLMSVSCVRGLFTDESEIVLCIQEELCDFSVKADELTKTTAVNSLPSSLYWGATTGSGSETAKWGSSSKAVSGGRIYTGQYQTLSPTTYNYYVSNVSLSVGSSVTVSATGGTSGTDVIVGRLSSNSSTPSVSLRHIFARTGSLSFAGLPEGISVVSSTWYIKTAGSNLGTAGTYNLTTGAWSSTSGISSWTTFTGATDMYVIPGTYSIRADFTDSNGNAYSQTANVTFTAGYVCDIRATPTGIVTVVWQEGGMQFNIKTSGNIVWKAGSDSGAKKIWYSKDKTKWTPVTSSTSGVSIPVTAGDVLYIYGDNSAYSAASLSSSDYSYFSTSSGCTFEASGNIMSLRNFDSSTVLSSCCFRRLFSFCTGLLTPPELPCTKISYACYADMFYQCSSLRAAPVLPATSLAADCYYQMFQNCTSLTTPPALPATVVAAECYYRMFFGCSSLTSAPALPATNLRNVYGCYQDMFGACTSLTVAPELPATDLTNSSYCYSGMFNSTGLITTPELPATTLAEGCYFSMFGACGSLTTAKDLPATVLASHCYDSMFGWCRNLTKAPVLPAATLASGCYENMFNNCSKLKYIKALFTTTPSSSYTNNWVSSVASTGTFVKADAATWNVTGNNGVPTGWTVYTESTDPRSRPGDFSVSSTKKVKFAPGPLYYNGSSFAMYDDWNHDSYSSAYGKTANSTYFTYNQLSYLFDGNGHYNENINNLLDPFDGWRMLSYAECCTLTTGVSPGTSREGSTVNGSKGIKFALVQLTGVSHAGTSTPRGLILFPDGLTITGKSLIGMNNSDWTTGVTLSELDNYLEQGCVFLPSSGFYSDGWLQGGESGCYWTSTKYTDTRAERFAFTAGSGVYLPWRAPKDMYFPVRLVVDVE